MKKWILLLFMSSFAFARTPSDPLPAGFKLFPDNNIWNRAVDNAPLSSSNTVWMANAQATHTISFQFGQFYVSGGYWNGMPYNLMCGGVTPNAPVTWAATNYATESDTLPVAGLPIPQDAYLEGDPSHNDGGDLHLILIDTCTSMIYETFKSSRTSAWGGEGSNYTGAWTIMQLSTWSLTSNALRIDGWTSADAAGLPIMPGLVNWNEVNAGSINHAIRFTLALTSTNQYIWPARHKTNSGSVNYPPFGMRVRLKASFDISGYSATNQIILRALKKYGMILADNGTAWQLVGAPSANWSDSDLANMKVITGNDFEVVDESLWMVNPNSGEARVPNNQTIQGNVTIKGNVQLK